MDNERETQVNIIKTLASAGILALVGTSVFAAENYPMGFFITSSGVGNGGDLGGVEGADAHCTSLAEAAGSTGRT